MSKAIVLLSGGIDSCVCLAIAKASNKEIVALSFDYNQRHKIELEYAKKLAAHFKVEHKIVSIDPAFFSGSALIEKGIIKKGRTVNEMATQGVPNTYVPARNTLFIAYAIAQAEMSNADKIYLGPNLLDQNPYPDCRPAFYQAYQQVANLATKRATTGKAPQLITPLINWDKTRIIKEGKALDCPFELTFSCYDPINGKEPCKSCDACILRKELTS